MRIRLFFQATSDRMKAHSPNLNIGRLKVDIKINFFMKRIVKYRNELLREMGGHIHGVVDKMLIKS